MDTQPEQGLQEHDTVYLGSQRAEIFRGRAPGPCSQSLPFDCLNRFFFLVFFWVSTFWWISQELFFLCCLLHRIMESYRVEKASGTIEFSCSLSTVKPATKPYPRPHLYVFKISPRMVTPTLPWAACSNL